jgi:predicted lysophospholipase L1 biosynthesis ABC-type transport system permease subunit
VGTLTTLIFAAWAIVAASRAQPMALLRNEPVDVRQIPRWQSVVLLVVLALPFTGMVSLVMGSLVSGLLVLLIALAGLVCLGGLFAGLLWVFSHLVPLRRLPLLHMAQNSLRRRGLALVFAMIALFVGVLAMTFGVVVSQNGQREMDMRSINLPGANLNILAPASQLGAIQQAVQNLGDFPTSYQLKSPVQEILPVGSSPDIRVEPLLVGISKPTGYTLEGAAWGSQPDGVYVEKNLQIPNGSLLQIKLADGNQQEVKVVGTYTPVNDLGYILPTPRGILLSTDYLTRLAAPRSLVYFIQVPNSQLPAVTASLGQALPESTVINLVAYATRFTQVYRNLFILAMAMSSLALLAGFLLVANSVSLAMLDRRYEIGVLKSFGYAQKHILMMQAAEYGLIACIATLAGMLAVRGYLFYLSLSNRLAGSLFNFSLSTVLLVLGCGVGLTLLIVTAVTWRPTRVSPVAILNERV